MLNIKDVIRFLTDNQYQFQYMGKDEINISGYSSFNNITENKISWVKNQANFNEKVVMNNKDIVLIVNSDVVIKSNFARDNGIIVCDNPKEIFFSILRKYFPTKTYESYISPVATVEACMIGDNVFVGHYSYIGNDVVIGNNVVIKYNVSIEGKVKIGDNTIIHSGVRIGTDGFGLFQDEDGRNVKVPHYGGVVIGNDVEIGANTCIDKGTLDDTIIGDNVKIDNLCHIAHNCVIRDKSVIVALAMLGGSTKLEAGSYVAPGAMIKNQLKIGANSLVGMGSVVIKDVENNKVVAGVPARVIRDNK